MKITVAIACYNLENRITVCLESVVSQNYDDIEILVVDDCSTDGSVDVVKKLAECHPDREIRIIKNETNLGLCKVRNISIREARGEAIFFMDGDDTIEPGTISLFQRRMEETGVEVVAGSFRKTDVNGNTLLTKQFPEDTIKGDFAYSSYIEKHIRGFFWTALWNNLYRLDFLRTNNIYCATSYRKHEQCLFTFKVVIHAKSISYINDVTYNWYDNPKSITHGIKKENNFLELFHDVIVSVIDAKNNFESCNKNISLPCGVRFDLNYVILSQGYLREGMLSESISKKEKKQFLKRLRKLYRDNNMHWSNIAGPYNRASYLILVSPFPYALFRYYYRHLKSFAAIIERLSKIEVK